MRVKLLKSGRGFSIEVPQRAISEARLHEGDLLEIFVRGEGLIELCRADSFPSLQELVSQITPENRYSEISTGTPVGRENES